MMQQYTEKSTSYDENKKSFIGENEKSLLEVFLNIKILVSVYNNLVKPTLAPGQEGITGVILRPVYTVRLVGRFCRTDKLYRVNCVKRVTFP